MLYKVFNLNQEQEINDFLEEHKAEIGEKGYWNDPKSGKLIFLFNDDFQPDFTCDVLKRSYLQAQYKNACEQLAKIEIDLMRLDREDPQTTLGTGEMIRLGRDEIEKTRSAKDMLKDRLDAHAGWSNVRVDLARLILGEKPKCLAEDEAKSENT